ncbi:MAG: carboxypeptidase regulatory-like domain-containing protein [Bryobacteraceae bacterium]
MARRQWVAWMLACAGWVTPAAAQRDATLCGRILDASDSGIGGAQITAVNQDTGFRRQTESAGDGAYSIASLAPGSYKVTVRKDGFRTLVRFNVELVSDRAAVADFALPVGSVLETITVEGTPSPLDRMDVSVGTDFDRGDIARLPLNGGGLLTLLDAAANINITPATRGEAGQFSTNGQRPNVNAFTVDGASANTGITAGGLPAQATGGTLPATSAFGSMDALVSLDAVEDIAVRTSTASVEFGRRPGAQVSITTQTGSNQFHGGVSFSWRNQLLSANNWFANQGGFGRVPLSLANVAPSLGGPLKRDRVFFFLAYQHIALDQPFVWEQPVPSLAERQSVASWAQPAVDLFPAPNGAALTSSLAEWSGFSSEPAGLNAGNARFDEIVSPRVNWFARYHDAPSNNAFGLAEIDRLSMRTQSLTLGLNAGFNSRTVMELRVNESQSSANSVWTTPGDPSTPSCDLQSLPPQFPTAPTGCNALVRLTIGGVGQLVTGEEGLRLQRQFQAVDIFSLRLGNHALEWGADYRRITAIRRDPTASLGLIADTIADLASTQNLWVAISQPTRQTAGAQELSSWIGDTWRAASRLTVTAGLRWEFSPAPTGPIFVLSGGTISSQTRIVPLWPLRFGNLAPRLGLAWRLTADGKTVLRAGGGLYYDSSMSIAADALNGGPLGIAQYFTARNGLFSSELTYAFLPDLRLPEVGQWNLHLERALSAHDTLSLGYVGAAGFDLVRREVGGTGSTLNSPLALTTDNGRSRYHALEAEYRRRFAPGLDTSVTYTWAHAIDNDSSDAYLMWTGSGMTPASDRANADFDLRHSFAATFAYTIPRRRAAAAWTRFAADWNLSAILRARSGFPVTVLDSEQYTGIPLNDAFRPTYVYGQALWLTDPHSPRGRRLNPAAFESLGSGVEGDLGRNAIGGFGMWQADFSASRGFRLDDLRSLELRADVYNLFNHPNFGDPVRYLDNPLLGQSTSMLNMMLGTGSPGSGLSPLLGAGGPRGAQLEIKLRF